MFSGVARVEIKAVKKLHGGKNFDAITKLHRIYFGSYSIKISISMICKWPSFNDLNMKMALREKRLDNPGLNTLVLIFCK